MGKKSPPANQTSTTTSKTEIDPDLKNQLVSNFNAGNVLTSGMLPQFRSAGGAASTSPLTAGAYGGGSYDPSTGSFTPNAVTSTGSGSGLVTDPNPSNYVNPDGSAFAPPSSFTAGFDPAQIAAQNAGLDFAGTNPDLSGANRVGNELANFNWTAQQAPVIGAAQTALQSPMLAAQIAKARDVSAKTFDTLDFNKYTTPYKNQVVDPITNYFSEMGDRSASSAIGSNRLGGAVRGSNEALTQALVRGETNLQGGREIGNAYKDMFNTSAGLATSDLNRMLQADMSNQSADTTRNLAQGNLDQGAAQTNYQGNLTVGLNNTAAQNTIGMSNQNYINQANAANNQNQFASPLLRAQGANMLTQNALTQRGITQDNIALLDTIGGQRRGLTQARMDDPWKALSLRQGMVSGAMPSFSSQTGTTVGQSPYARSGGIAGALGGAAAGLGIYGGLTAGATPLLAASGPVGWGIAGLGALAGALG